jgi:hypothetical protein
VSLVRLTVTALHHLPAPTAVQQTARGMHQAQAECAGAGQGLSPALAPLQLQLRYIDFISSAQSVLPVMAALQRGLSLSLQRPCSIDVLPAPPHLSGPAHELQAVATFAHNEADLGRM